MDRSVLAFGAAVAILTGLVFGCVPVLNLLRRDLNEVFRQTGRTKTSEGGPCGCARPRGAGGLKVNPTR